MRTHTPWFRQDRGQMIVLAALAIVVLLGFLGLVVDVGRLYVARQQLSNACDAAVLAGAAKLATSANEAVRSAFDYYCRNTGGTPPVSPVSGTTYSISGTRDSVTVTTPYRSDPALIAVRAARTVPSVFMQLLGTQTTTVAASAVGRISLSALSHVSAMASADGQARTQPLGYRRSDGQRYAVVVIGNNVELGLDSAGHPVGTLVSGQNIYLRSNNGEGQAQYSDPAFPNSIVGNNLAPGLRNPALGSRPTMEYLDPAYYISGATNTGATYTGHQTLSGNNRTYGDITVNDGNLTITGNNISVGRIFLTRGNLIIDANNVSFNGFIYVNGNITITGNNPIGTVTFAASGYVRLTGSNFAITPADTQNHLIIYAGADASLGGAAYFGSPGFDPNAHYAYVQDNNLSTSGTIYAPYGYALLDGNNIDVRGSVIGESVVLNGNNIEVHFDPAFCPAGKPHVALTE